MSASYDDIINLPHPTSTKHPRMPMIDRAAQFSPFQALTGYGLAIQETARLTDQRVELTEDEQALLDEKLRLLLDTGEVGTLICFQPDEKKDGGAYVTIHSAVKKIDPLERCVVFLDGRKVSIDCIAGIESGSPKNNTDTKGEMLT